MDVIALKSQNIHQHTLINNLFIDHYMPKANGDYVKVYIYLLRLVVCGQNDFTTHQVAKQMNLIESDVIRALQYWSELKVLEATFDDDVLTSIGFLSLEKTEAAISFSTPDIVEPEVAPVKAEPVKKQVKIYERPQYSMDEMTMYSEQKDFKELVYIAQRYLQKPLTQNDLNILLGFVDWLGLPFDVVEFLVEHCAQGGHRHMNYIEKVAIDWADNNITTVEEAKSYTDQFNSIHYKIFNALGIKSHQPTPKQIKYMSRWIDEYNFAIEVIELACEKTIAAINKPELAYVDTILTRWHNKGIKSLEAVAELDQTFKDSKKPQSNNAPKTNNTKNRFHNHDQREYDYNDIEQKMKDLLKKKSNGAG